MEIGFFHRVTRKAFSGSIHRRMRCSGKIYLSKNEGLPPGQGGLAPSCYRKSPGLGEHKCPPHGVRIPKRNAITLGSYGLHPPVLLPCPPGPPWGPLTCCWERVCVNNLISLDFQWLLMLPRWAFVKIWLYYLGLGESRLSFKLTYLFHNPSCASQACAGSSPLSIQFFPTVSRLPSPDFMSPTAHASAFYCIILASTAHVPNKGMSPAIFILPSVTLEDDQYQFFLPAWGVSFLGKDMAVHGEGSLWMLRLPGIRPSEPRLVTNSTDSICSLP